MLEKLRKTAGCSVLGTRTKPLWGRGMDYICAGHESTGGIIKQATMQVGDQTVWQTCATRWQCNSAKMRKGEVWKCRGRASAVCMYVCKGLACISNQTCCSTGTAGAQALMLCFDSAGHGRSTICSSAGCPATAQPRVGVRDAPLAPKLATPLPPRVLKAVAPLWPYSGCLAAAATAGASASATAATAA